MSDVATTSSSVARFQRALANSGVLAFEHDTELRYTWIYPTQFYAASDVVGKTDAELFAPDDAERLMAIKRRVLLTGERASEEVFIVKNGHRHDYRLTVDPARDEVGQLIGLTGVSTNLTAQKRTQDELSRALVFRDKVIGILGHDLRNPLGAISMGAQVLRNSPAMPPEELHRHLLRIERSAKRMAEMISSLLDFAEGRFNSSLPICVGEVDLADVIRAVVDELRASLPARRILLEITGNSAGNWDGARLAQVVSNLVGNALKHGAPDGVVRVSLREDHDGVSFDVSNEGPIIPRDRISDIFKPFHSHHVHAASSAQRGLGLGLYIADQIVQAHRGSIGVSSTEETGTVFSVHLPRSS